jgi:hypothetical protein
MYYPSEIKRSMNDTWKQNAQCNPSFSQERKIIDMHHILKKNLIQKMCDKVLRTR